MELEAYPVSRWDVLFAAAIALLIYVAGSVYAARAHSFYPWECCSDQDCWPMGVDADAKEPEPRAGPAGWILTDGAIVPYREARPSPDGRFHVCRRGGRPDGEVIRPSAKPQCLYVPQPAF